METQGDLKTYIGNAIRRKRQQKNITLKNLAVMIGSTEPYMSNVERGKCQYTFEFLEKLIRALGYKDYQKFFSDLCQ